MANQIHGSMLVPPWLKTDTTYNRRQLKDYFNPGLFLRNFPVKMKFALEGLIIKAMYESCDRFPHQILG